MYPKNVRLWAIRVRLYQPGMTIPVLLADTHPDLSHSGMPEGSREVLVVGLNAIADEIAALIRAFHAGAQFVNTGDIARRLQSLRVRISTSGGAFLWSGKYHVDGSDFAWHCGIEQIPPGDPAYSGALAAPPSARLPEPEPEPPVPSLRTPVVRREGPVPDPRAAFAAAGGFAGAAPDEPEGD